MTIDPKRGNAAVTDTAPSTRAKDAGAADGKNDAVETLALKLGVQPYDPVAEIAIDVPYPTFPQEGSYWLHRAEGGRVQGALKQWGSFGLQTIRLDGTIRIEENAILWRPSDNARILLTTAMYHRFGSGAQEGRWENPPLDRVLCSIRLRSALIFADDPKTRRRIWLNAEHLSTRDKVTSRESLLGIRDPQKAADLDMFIYLGLAEPGIIFFYLKGSGDPHRSSLGTVEDALKAVLAQAGGSVATVHLAAYADDPGSADVNLKLSDQRARKIQAVLVSQGIDAKLITIEAFGGGQLPHPPAAPDAEDSLNLRVAVTFSPYKA